MAGLFDNIKEEMENNPIEKDNTRVKIDYTRNPALNLNYAKNILVNHVDELTDKELYEFLKKSYNILLKDIFEKDDSTYLDIIITHRFLTQFIQVLNSIELTSLERTYCNKLAYDYLVRSSGDSHVKDLFLSMSKSVNRDVIMSLHSIGIPDDVATMLTLSRFSSLKDDVYIKRLNHVMMMYDEGLMTPQTIIYIYERLFDSLTNLFIYTMYDPYDQTTLNNMNDDAGEIYSNIGLALCTMLNNQESITIRKVLLAYANSYNLKEEYREVRFPIKSLSVSDFRRVLAVAEKLETDEMMIVP